MCYYVFYNRQKFFLMMEEIIFSFSLKTFGDFKVLIEVSFLNCCLISFNAIKLDLFEN